MTRAEVPERRRTLLHPGLADLAKEALPGAIRRDLAVEARAGGALLRAAIWFEVAIYSSTNVLSQ
jgi:hypothetical protein